MPGGQQPATSQTSQTQNTSSTSGPNPTIAPMLGQGVQDLWNQYQQNPTAPGYYPGSTVATPSQATQSYWQTLPQAYQQNNNQIQAVDAYAGDVLGGKYLDINNNPYFQGALKAGFAPQTEQFNNSILPNIRSQFEGSGRNLGGADMDQSQIALKNLDTTQSNAAAQASLGAYNSERGLQQGVMQFAPQLQGMLTQNAGLLGQAGSGIDQYNQDLTNADVTKYNYNQNAQKNYISDFLSRIQAGYPGGQTQGTGSSSGYSTGTPASNPTASGIGAALGGLGTIAQFLPFFSDERLKEDIAPVGKLADGQNVYSYRYKGDPRTQIGLLAQEVEKIHPEAVATHSSGFKVVDYARATAPAGGLF